jgi:iron(III) transport system substrate-binding protein
VAIDARRTRGDHDLVMRWSDGLYFLVTLISIELGVACAPAPTAPPTAAPATAANAKPTAQSLDALYAAAKTEGQVALYSTLNTTYSKPLIDKFAARFPGVTVSHNRQLAEKLTEIMKQEASAGKMTWDVVEGPEDAFFGWNQSNYLQAYVPDQAATYSSDRKDPAGMWVSDRVNPETVALNTDLVKADEMPKTWTDMTDPRWKGRIAFDSTNVLLYAAMKDTWGAQKAGDYLRGIAANQPRLETSQATIAQLLAAGEFGAAVGTYIDTPHALQQKGAPIKIIGADPLFVQLQLVGLGVQAPHPNAAKLFINWLLSDEGQTAMNEVGVVPAQPEKYKAATEFIGPSNTVVISPALAVKAPDLTAEFNQILGIK